MRSSLLQGVIFTLIWVIILDTAGSSPRPRGACSSWAEAEFGDGIGSGGCALLEHARRSGVGGGGRVAWHPSNSLLNTREVKRTKGWDAEQMTEDVAAKAKVEQVLDNLCSRGRGAGGAGGWEGRRFPARRPERLRGAASGRGGREGVDTPWRS